MIQITWTNTSPTQVAGSINNEVWYRLRRVTTPFADNVWQVVTGFPFPYEEQKNWPTLDEAKAAIEASLTSFVGILVLLGVALVPEA